MIYIAAQSNKNQYSQLYYIGKYSRCK